MQRCRNYRVRESECADKADTDAATWLQRESVNLRRVALMLDSAGVWMEVVLTRSERPAQP
jgi:hypothetical protein